MFFKAKPHPIARSTTAEVKKQPTKKVPAMTREQKNEIVTHFAPEEAKPHFVEVEFWTGKDSYLDPMKPVRAERIQGRPENENAKRYNMTDYDQNTVMAFIARISASTAATNPLRRLTPNAGFRVIARVGISREDSEIRVTVREVKRLTEKSGKIRVKTLHVPKADEDGNKDAMDTDLKLIRRASRNLRGAFTAVQQPPAKRRSRSSELDE